MKHLFSLGARLALYLAALAALIICGADSGQWLPAFVALFIIDSLLAGPLAGRKFAFDNVTGTLAPNLIVQKALELVFTIRPMLRAISLGFQDLDGTNTAFYNTTAYTRTLAIPAVTNFGSAATDTADVDVPVTLNNYKQVLYTFTSAQLSGTNRNLLAERAMPLAIALANHMVDQVAAVWTVANFARAATAVAGAWSYTNTLLELRKALKKAGVPQGAPWFAALNEDVITSLLADPLAAAWINNQRAADVISSGNFQNPLAGLILEEYPSLPAANNLIGFAGTPDSVVYAARAPINPEQIPGFDASFPGTLEYITEPNSGFTVLLSKYIGTDLSASVRLCWMYGVAKGNANNGQRLVSAGA